MTWPVPFQHNTWREIFATRNKIRRTGPRSIFLCKNKFKATSWFTSMWWLVYFSCRECSSNLVQFVRIVNFVVRLSNIVRSTKSLLKGELLFAPIIYELNSKFKSIFFIYRFLSRSLIFIINSSNSGCLGGKFNMTSEAWSYESNFCFNRSFYMK